MSAHNINVYEIFFNQDAVYAEVKAFDSRMFGQSDQYNAYLRRENEVINIILIVLESMRVSELEIVYEELFDKESRVFASLASDNLILDDIFLTSQFRHRDDIISVLRFLCRDLGFVTLGCKKRILIIPEDGLRFTLCLPSDVHLNVPNVVKAETNLDFESLNVFGLNKMLP